MLVDSTVGEKAEENAGEVVCMSARLANFAVYYG